MTISIFDLTNPKIDLSSTGLKFTGSAHDVDYALDLEFFDEVDVDNSKQHTTDRGVIMVLRKKEMKEEYWPRLTKNKARLPYIKTDFDKWVDEDEQNEADDDLGDLAGMGGMPPMGMGGEGTGGLDLSSLMGGAGGAGGMAGLDALKNLGGGDMSALQDALAGGGAATADDDADQADESAAKEGADDGEDERVAKPATSS